MEQNSYKSGSLASVVCTPLQIDKLITTNPLDYTVTPPSLIDSAFHAWAYKGRINVKDLFKEGHFIAFQQLQEVFNLVFVRKYFSSTLQTPAYSWIEGCLEIDHREPPDQDSTH